MNRIAWFVLLSAALTQTLPTAHAQSGRWGVIVNEKTKGCASFWEGNSCTSVKVPQGWSPLLPVWDGTKDSLVLTYKDKTCLLGSRSAEQCCAAFGLSFDKEFRAPHEKTPRVMDPKSECFQLPSQQNSMRP